MLTTVAATGAHGGEVRALQQQLSLHLAALEAAAAGALQPGCTPAATGALSAALSQLQRSRLLTLLDASASSNSTGSELAANALQKLVTRATSLLGTNLARPDGPASQLRGFLLAFELADQTHFDVWANSAATWAQHCVSTVSGATVKSSTIIVRAALRLADVRILTGALSARLDYHRQVVLPNVPKFGAALVRLAEVLEEPQDARADTELLVESLRCLTSQIHQFASTYRPFASRLHEIVIKLLLSDIDSPVPTFGPLHFAAARLMSALHLCGASNATAARHAGSAYTSSSTQAHLWHATATSVIRTMTDVASVCTSTLAKPSGVRIPSSGDRLPLAVPTEDGLDIHAGLVSTLLRLNGALHVLLSCPTPSPVPIPLAAIIDSARQLLVYGRHTRMKPGSDATLHARQVGDMERLQIASVSLIALTVAASQQGAQQYAATILTALTTFLIRNAESVALRTAALNALAVLLGTGEVSHTSVGRVPTARLSIDPGSRNLPKLAQFCLAEVSRLFTLGRSHAASSAEKIDGHVDGGARKAKRQRLYEGSNIFDIGHGGPFTGTRSESMDSASAAVSVFQCLFPHLSSNLRPPHADLSQAGVLVLLALAELLMHSSAAGTAAVAAESGLERARTRLIATTLSCLAHVMATGPGRLLSLVSARAWTVFELGRRSPMPLVCSAAQDGFIVLDRILHARVPALLPLRLADEPDIGHEAAQWGDEERKLAEVQMDLLRGVSEHEAMVKVLDIASATQDKSDPATLGLGHPDHTLATPLKRTASAVSHGTGSGEPPQSIAQQHPQHLSHTHNMTLSQTSRASPDPVKPFHRPSTPRIGSPSPSRKAFADRADDPRLPETPSKRADDVTTRQLSSRLDISANELATDGSTEGDSALPCTTVADPVNGREAQSAKSHFSLLAGHDSEDEAMPQIDLDSDEDSE